MKRLEDRTAHCHDYPAHIYRKPHRGRWLKVGLIIQSIIQTKLYMHLVAINETRTEIGHRIWSKSQKVVKIQTRCIRMESVGLQVSSISSGAADADGGHDSVVQPSSPRVVDEGQGSDNEDDAFWDRAQESPITSMWNFEGTRNRSGRCYKRQ